MNSNYVDFFQRFLKEYARYFKDYTLPETADQDVKYALELQGKRLRQKGYSIEYDYEPRGHFAQGGGLYLHWGDDIYDNSQQYRTYRQIRTIYKDGRKVHCQKENELFYEIITSAVNPQPLADEPYVCPNCSGVVKIRELENGCPYCGTRFKMTELFPKVSNFFHIRDHGRTETEMKTDLKKIILPLIFFSAVATFLFIADDIEPFWWRIVSSAILGVIYGGIGGFMFYGWKLLFALLHDAGRALTPVMSAAGSKKKFTELMKQYSPDFSYEYFNGKVSSMLKTIIFSENKSQLPFYQGKDLDRSMENIIESNMFSNAGVQKYRVNGDHIDLTVTMYMQNIYATKYGIKRKTDTFLLALYRDISKPINYNFSIHKISCKTCGGSFDAGKNTHCPYCGNPYPIEEDEWIITSLLKV